MSSCLLRPLGEGCTHFTTESISPEEGSSVKRTVTFCHGLAVPSMVGRGEGGGERGGRFLLTGMAAHFGRRLKGR